MHDRALGATIILSAAFAILITIVTTSAPTAAAQAPPPKPSGEAGTYTGPGSCSAVACHGAIRAVAGSRILQTEYSTWIAQDRHARAADALSGAVSQRMGHLLGIAQPEHASKCLACHALEVPPSARARTFTEEGVSCEACHGPATGWLGYHVTKDARHDESVRRGMYDTKDVVKRTERCLTCHLGTAEKSVDHEMIAAGHPDLVFDLEAFSAAMPRHWREGSTDDAYAPVRTFAVGQLVHLRASLDRLSRRVAGPVWPEYAELDCFACHHSLTRPEDSWRQAQGYERRARPGNPPLNVARYVTARRVLAAWDAAAASELDVAMTHLQIESSRLRVNTKEVAGAAASARAIVDRGVARALAAAAPTTESTAALLRGIVSDAPAIAESGERAAEQAAMAMETLATALARAKGQDTAALKGAFADVFQQFETPSTYDPRRFVAAIKKVETALRY
jgi:hypothetical protein